MNVQQVPPSGVPAVFTVEVPAPEGMDTVAGVRLRCVGTANATGLRPVVKVDGDRGYILSRNTVPGGRTWDVIFPAHPAPASVEITCDFHLEQPENSSLTLTAQGAQTETGAVPMNPDAGGDPTFFGGSVEVGRIEILSWLEWRRLNEGGGS